MIIIEIAEIWPERRGWFTASLQRRWLCTSRQPFLDAARVLLREGFGPWLILQAVNRGTPSLRSTIGAAAKLTVAERPSGSAPKFERWKGLPSTAAVPRVAEKRVQA